MSLPRFYAISAWALLASTVVAQAAMEDAPVRPSREIVFKVSPDAGEADGHIEASLDIAAPPAQVWKVMLDCSRAQKFFTALKSCKVLDRAADGSTDIREHRSQWLALLPETVSVFRSVYKVEREIDFERVSGDFRFLKGSWHLRPLEGGRATRLSYDARIGINGAIPLPSFMIRAALEQDVPKFLAAFRDEVEQTP